MSVLTEALPKGISGAGGGKDPPPGKPGTRQALAWHNRNHDQHVAPTNSSGVDFCSSRPKAAVRLTCGSQGIDSSFCGIGGLT